jgi:hypothetical protein
MQSFDKGGYYQEIYRRMYDFHRQYASCKNEKEKIELLESLPKDIGISNFETDLIYAISREIERKNVLFDRLEMVV